PALHGCGSTPAADRSALPPSPRRWRSPPSLSPSFPPSPSSGHAAEGRIHSSISHGAAPLRRLPRRGHGRRGGARNPQVRSGACLGGWSSFKVATRLRLAGHRVSTPDLAASGVDPRPLREVPTFRDYTKPLLDLLESLPPGEKVVLVGHSLGGVNVALACELFPEKIAAAVFVATFMPDHRSPPSYVLEKFMEGRTLDWMDTEFKPQDPEGKRPTSMLFGPLVTRAKFFQLCSPEDLTLGRSLMRVSSMFVDDLRLQPPYMEARYGSVPASPLQP
ncbi:salicylic acid-binding protein 2-like, partial [Triticum dicoccoides]|uniref:salicylic acid-binding protein 2-like n=1 Tax=Triticum dicoccoides TaxID=85692 RepID=UPI001891240B